ncbi:KilA, /APSES-type HTH DNA-binding domain protein [Crinalium epipsammum PCC 9333]|uniref:KilA, /APSES-type HTH DNA-binding domain protein n=1 Tax=Crinalium epipsammum PCC 9333 TaxID=1173022 RepID=K9VV86_9CYAN|nr:KilA-N domain-containing protein [Crinalium epipsammum]AFZ11474.1 KilA, /APSES-type HTH DNA-binding domain protein [Crinalium epipsammum PCC 9333]
MISAIAQRKSDGYINATAMCKAAGKKWNNYYQNDSTKEYLEALAVDLGLDVIVKNPVTTIPATALVQVFQGGNATQGTWVHYEIAVDLGKSRTRR